MCIYRDICIWKKVLKSSYKGDWNKRILELWNIQIPEYFIHDELLNRHIVLKKGNITCGYSLTCQWGGLGVLYVCWHTHWLLPLKPTNPQELIFRDYCESQILLTKDNRCIPELAKESELIGSLIWGWTEGLRSKVVQLLFPFNF